MEYVGNYASFIAHVMSIFILVGLTEGAREDYIRTHPKQPGWGIYVFGFTAIFALVVL